MCERNKLFGKLGDLVYVHSNLKLLKNKAANESSSSQQWTLEDIAVPDANEPDFFDEELSSSSDTNDDAKPPKPSALDELELF